MPVRCIWLDSSARKACRVLRARLLPLGYTVVCRSNLPDKLIDQLALRMGCIVVSSDRRFSERPVHRARWVYLHPRIVAVKSARDLTTRIVKIVFSRRNPRHSTRAR